jgi:hypothetical protein
MKSSFVMLCILLGPVSSVLAQPARSSSRDDSVAHQRAELDAGYAAMRENDRSEAVDRFENAAEGPDPALAAQAERELDVLPSHFWGDFYGEALVWQRLHGYDNSNAVFSGRLRGLWRPSLEVDFNFYVFAQATRDVRSTGTADLGVPLIYADNYALLGAGMMLRLGYVGFFIQAGPGFNLADDGRDSVVFDARGGVLASYDTSQCRLTPSGGTHFVSAPCAEVYGEAVWVHRFDDDVIGALRGRLAFGWLLTGPLLWQWFVEARAVADINGDYYNNFAEAGVGHRWRLLRPIPIDVLAGIHAGTYLGIENVDRAPEPLTYVEARLLAATYFDF